MEVASAVIEAPEAVPAHLDDAPAAPRPMSRASSAALWLGALGLMLAVHGAIVLALLTRPLPGAGAPAAVEPVFDLDLSAAGAGEEAAGDPALDPVPDIPVPDIPEPEVQPPDATEASATEVSLPAAAAEAPTLAAPPSPSPPAARPERPPAQAEEARRRAKARELARQTQERAEAARARKEEARRPAAAGRREAASAARGAAPSRSASLSPAGGSAPSSAGASAAASAAWRSQIVGILRSRFGGGKSGLASVNFSVTKGGQLAGARLTASSGDPRLDAAALAVFRGSVPPPPAGYVGALNFNVRLGVR